FKDAGFTPSDLGTHYTLADGSIIFDTKGIAIQHLKLLDTAKHAASVNGYIYTRYFKDFRFQLDVKSDHFKALSTTAKDNPRSYGTFIVSSNARIRGTLQKPVIDVNATVEEG